MYVGIIIIVTTITITYYYHFYDTLFRTLLLSYVCRYNITTMCPSRTETPLIMSIINY